MVSIIHKLSTLPLSWNLISNLMLKFAAFRNKTCQFNLLPYLCIVEMLFKLPREQQSQRLQEFRLKMPCHYNVSNYGKGKSPQEPRWHAAAAVAPPNCNHIVVTRNIGPAGDLESTSNIQTCKPCMMRPWLFIFRLWIIASFKHS